jgi:xanthine dehydrogenase accessory factor
MEGIVDRRESERLVRAIREAQATGVQTALATVVRVRGSAYRREGTRMLVREDGTYECALSGSCLEPSVAERALRVIASGDALIVNYDLADDSLWGLGMGCSGAVDIRIERIDDDQITREWLTVLERAEKAVQITPLSGASGRIVLHETGTVAGTLSDASVARVATQRAYELLREAQPNAHAEMIEGAEIFFEISVPPPSLVIFGAGHDAVPIAELAWTMSFSVTVVDVRKAFLSAERFPNAKLVSADFSEFGNSVVVTPQTFVLILNHHTERDQESLRFALSAAAGYIGMLGPRARYEKLLSGLKSDGFVPQPAALARVRSPVGLSLGAETPEEVAVSIMGEILAVQRGFEGGFLEGWTGSLHRPGERRALARS